jgi:hypothetical protein
VKNYATVNVVYGRAFILKWLAGLTAPITAGLLATAKLRLSKDPQFNPTPDSLLSALAAMEADFSGYPAGGKAVILASYVGSSASADSAYAQVIFTAAAATPQVSNTVTGYWIDDGTEVCVAERFSAGQTAPFDIVGDYLGLTALVPLQFYQTP